jgi:AraC-like DNA-binding protein
MLMEPGETHCTTTVASLASFKVLFVPPPIFIEAAAELKEGHLPHFRYAGLSDRRLFYAVNRFYAAVKTAESPLEQESWFIACIRAMLDRCEQPLAAFDGSDAHRAVERAKRYLRERFNEPVSLHELASEAAISRFHLVRLFTKYTGMPPHAYQMEFRLAQARALLRARIPSASVAEDVGFADQSHFTRCFKRVMGVTPGAYVRAGA